ncbi:LytR/AlgR family response regulator transcription factor [Deminuibacter soli]|uniref:LytTR family transcriptional regulator n=1 Tax=Deminuibacter soli TaxID=2291815 RepID=A0A3E1NL62_9BACT|nr:LytTR family DNA-binding domain-containing protein [Deminuibacter soli]RFM28584.1 LytTR family transcriptional regulator [Deminuibacter soli]
MQFLIVNEQAFSCQALRTIIMQCRPAATVYTCATTQQAADLLQQHEITAMFLKVKDWNYTSFAEMQAHHRPLLVFISEHNEKGTELLAKDLSLHLKEPYCLTSVNRILLNIEHGLFRAQYHWNFFFIKHNYRFKKIHFPDVQCIEAKTNYITITVPGNQFMIACSLNKIMTLLPQQQFFRVNRHLVLPAEVVQDAHKGRLLYGDREIRLSRRRRREGVIA